TTRSLTYLRGIDAIKKSQPDTENMLKRECFSRMRQPNVRLLRPAVSEQHTRIVNNAIAYLIGIGAIIAARDRKHAEERKRAVAGRIHLLPMQKSAAAAAAGLPSACGSKFQHLSLPDTTAAVIWETRLTSERTNGGNALCC